MSVCPARLGPVFSPRPWGAHSLAPFFPEHAGLVEPIGEAWMTGNECQFLTGPFCGLKVADAWAQMSSEWSGTAVDRQGDFPLLVKFLFSEDKLSVQVHPDDEHAARYESGAGSRGKTEMWYAVRASPGASVLVGLDPGLTAEDFHRAVCNGTVEDCLRDIPLQAGESVFVPAGTAHTIGSGLLLCEIQQHSDITYRVFDYNRRDAKGNLRLLHIEKALQVMRFGEQLGGKIDPVRLDSDGVMKTYLAACPYFATEKWESSARMAGVTSPEHFDLLIFVEGHGDICCRDALMAYHPMEVWMLPATLGNYHLQPGTRTSVLRTYVPGNSSEFAREMASHGVSDVAIARLIHP